MHRPRNRPQRDAITMLAATIVRGAQDAAVQQLFAWVADEARPGWQRSALLRGAEVALLGAAMPGSPTGDAVARPARRPRRAVSDLSGRARRSGRRVRVPATGARGAGGSGRSGGGPGLRLNREPAALSALAARGGDLGARAQLCWRAWSGRASRARPRRSRR